MKKILMLTHEFPPFRGGIATYACELATAAQALGHEVTVVAPDFGEDLTERDRATYQFTVRRYKAGVYSRRELLSLLIRSWQWSRLNRYDLLHAVDVAYVMGLSFVNRFKRAPFVATAYGTDILAMPNSKQAKVLGVRNMFSFPSRVFTISRFTRDLLVDRCRTVSDDMVHITYLGVDSRWFEPTGKTDEVLEKFAVPKDHKIVLTVARLDERKGHRTILKAISHLEQRLKQKLTYLIVGKSEDSPYRRELQALAGECDAKVIFAGGITDDDLRALYAAADIYCMPGEPHPKKVEGFGLVYLEAAAQKLPSIASAIGAVPEVVLHDKTGLMIEPGDEKGLTETLTKLLTDEPYRRALGGAACEYARTFTWKRCAEKTYGV